MDLPRLIAQYGTDDRCRMVLEQLRWPDGPRCLRCGAARIVPISTRPGLYRCADCQYQFSVMVGTIFNDSHLPLTKWFLATYLMVEAKKGVSANQLKRTLDVSYKTAWYLCHRIRAAMREASPLPLDGIVEVDETYVGVKRRHLGHGYRGNKTMVLGAAQRGGPIRLRIDKHADRKTLHAFIKGATKDETCAIYTDELLAYKGIADHNTRHETVNHHAEEWVRADVHTNTVESVWSLLKRSIVGSYHQLSAKHLTAYLDEMAWRFNNRRNPYLFRDTLLRLLEAKAVPFKTLISASGGVG
jgi:transposase-like protein